MKRILSAILVLMMLFTLVALSGCGKKEAAPVKMGLGVAPAFGNSTNAEGETNGKTASSVVAAAVLVDADGKIVAAVIDEMAADLAYTSAGKVVVPAELKTKAELGADYGMAAYGTDLNKDGVVKEWNEQIAIFADAVKGKTIEEAKALVANGYAAADIQTAGCTMAVASYAAALEKAVANAVESAATADATLKLGFAGSVSGNDFSEEKAGAAEADVTVTAAAVKDGKVVVAATDCAQIKVGFDAKGVVTTDVKAAISTKKELGTDYGMAAYGADLNKDGVVKEWNEQAAAFDAALAGKTATEIAALEANGYGVEALQTAGCTIAVSDMVKAAVKAATVA